MLVYISTSSQISPVPLNFSHLSSSNSPTSLVCHPLFGHNFGSLSRRNITPNTIALMPLFANWMSVPVLPLPTIAGAARTPAAARRRVIIAVCLFAIGVVTLASVGLWVPIVKSLHHKHKNNGNTMEVAVGIFKRQFQGGGIIGELTADVSKLGTVSSHEINLTIAYCV